MRWLRHRPVDVTRVEGPSEGEKARRSAEVELARQVERTAQVRAETPWYQGIAQNLRIVEQENHIRELVLGALRKE